MSREILSSVVLPPEITDAILDYCHSDPRTLSTCALVCRAWYATSRYHLFSAVQLLEAKKTERFTELLQYKTSRPSPNITPFLRNLTLRISADGLWIHSLLSVLPDYIPLEFLSVICVEQHLTDDIKKKFTGTFRSITNLALYETTSLSKSLSRDVEFICAFPELKTVLLSGDHYRDTAIDFRGLRLPSRVQELKLDLASSATEALMEWLLAHETVPTMTALHLARVTDDRVPALQQYIQFCKHSLEELRLFLYQRRTDPADFDLSHHIALKSIHLSASGPDSIRTIRDILSCSVTSENLSNHPKHIILRISTFELSNVYDWASMDKLLSSNKSLSPMITVVMDKAGYEATMMARLAVCASHKQLKIVCSEAVTGGK
ncbi:hypothetical protein L218DRAFT_956418 [Marasmius fiardii PR-910]|nr:hypothetical protein L218DRAFT_956418 [Marasmius fiardii PR-910]